MMQIIDLNCQLYITDEDRVVEDSGKIAVITPTGEPDYLILTIANCEGKNKYVISKKFARELGRALIEESKK